jgi:hypothetical protein
MQFTVSRSTVFRCSLERAFKAPMLCDISKVHTGFLVMPKVTHCTHDEGWGQVGSSKRVIGARSIAFKGGEASTDRVLERVENQYWKIQVDDFQTWIVGFERFVGEWRVTELAPGEVRVDYTYTLHAGAPLLALPQWLFAKGFWPVYMKRVLENVRVLAEGDAPFLCA